MKKLRRRFDAAEVTQEFFDFFERTGEIPTVHIGTDSQIHKFKKRRVFRFVTVVLLHHNSVDPEFRIAKAWGHTDFERANTFVIRKDDGAEKVADIFVKSTSKLNLDLNDGQQAFIQRKLAEVALSLGLEHTDNNEMIQPMSGKVTGHNVTLRMLSEAARTLAIANSLTGLYEENVVLQSGMGLDDGEGDYKQILTPDDILIGVDINEDPNHLSNGALTHVVSLLKGFGYQNIEWKPNSMITYAADRLSK